MTPLSPEEFASVTNDTFVNRLEFHPLLGSTNDRSLELAREPHLETPLIVLAATQTAGRGRGANRWWSGDGALTFSLILEPGLLDLPPTVWPRVAVVTGLTLCEAFADRVPSASVRLKWPNDVHVDGKKVAGILVEVPPAAYPVPARLVVGIGINVNNSWRDAPDEIRDKGTALCDVGGAALSPGELLTELMNRLSDNLRQLAETPEVLAPRWRACCALTGKTVEIQQGERLVRGVCLGIDDDGALLVQQESDRIKLYGGTVAKVS